jgi:hypothetical protein
MKESFMKEYTILYDIKNQTPEMAHGEIAVTTELLRRDIKMVVIIGKVVTF